MTNPSLMGASLRPAAVLDTACNVRPRHRGGPPGATGSIPCKAGPPLPETFCLLLGQQFQNDDDHEGDREDGRACLEDRAHLGFQSTTPRNVCNEAAVGELLGAASGERPLAQSTH